MFFEENKLTWIATNAARNVRVARSARGAALKHTAHTGHILSLSIHYITKSQKTRLMSASRVDFDMGHRGARQPGYPAQPLPSHPISQPWGGFFGSSNSFVLYSHKAR